MGRIRLLPGTRYLLHDQVFLIRQVLVAGNLLVENLAARTKGLHAPLERIVTRLGCARSSRA